MIERSYTSRLLAQQCERQAAPSTLAHWTAMKEGLLGGKLRRVTENRTRGGPFTCCTLDSI